MKPIRIPEKVVAQQVNLGERFGDFWASWNLDLTSDFGSIRVAPRALVDTSATPSVIIPIAFVRNMAGTPVVDTYFSIGGAKVYKVAQTSLGLGFSQDTLANSPTTQLSRLYSDAVDFNGSLMVSLNTGGSGGGSAATVARLPSGSTWTVDWYGSLSGSPNLTTGIPHPLCVGFTKELLIGNGNVIASVTTGGTVSTARLTVGAEYECMWIRSSNSLYWFGMRHKYGGDGKIFSWDGQSAAMTGDYKMGSDITFSGLIKDEIPYTVNGVGQLLKFTGYGFTEIARFPVANEKINRFQETLNSTAYPININRNGMALVDGNIHIFLNASIRDVNGNLNYLENMLSGVWEYTELTGLYHKYGVTKSTDSNTLDYGSPTLYQAGAIYPLGASNRQNKFLMGADLYVADGGSTTTQIGVINSFGSDTKNKYGYFITRKIYSSEIEENWQKIFSNFKQLMTTGDFIAIKYRTSRTAIPTETNLNSVGALVGTWASTTTFTTSLSYFSSVVAGNEVEILSGEGSGMSTTISSISGSGPYTVTIDHAVTGASGTFNFRVSNWTEVANITDLVRVSKEVTLGQKSEWIQFKVVLFGSGGSAADITNSPEFHKLTLLSVPQVQVK